MEQTDLVDAVERLVEPTERGDPQSPLRWTCKSLSNLQRELVDQGYRVGRTKISKVLRTLGYSLQGNRKTREGTDHPDRNAQFEHIARRVRACQRGGRPAVSVDTKKKEALGKKANVGREYRPAGSPLEVDTHDFPDKKLGKAIPYGVYDIDSNEAWVSVGISRDTAEFAVEAVRRWWQKMGRKRYKKPSRLLITADSGGSNGHRNRLWEYELQRLADETGMIMEVCHYPPGTSNPWENAKILVRWRFGEEASYEFGDIEILEMSREIGLDWREPLRSLYGEDWLINFEEFSASGADSK